MAIIIGDIHGDLAMAQAFLAYMPETEHIALGDYVDSRDKFITPDMEVACLDLLVNSHSKLLWGNHDLAYLNNPVFDVDGRFQSIRNQLTNIYETNIGRFLAAYSADGWLCTHAGVSSAVTSELPDGPWDSDTKTIADYINSEFINKNEILFKVDWTRGGKDQYGGIFWFDPRWENVSPDPRIKQIFGHTKTEGPIRKLNHINIHIEDGCWIFDTETDGFKKLQKNL